MNIGVCFDPEILSHLKPWKGRPETSLEDDDFFDALVSVLCSSSREICMNCSNQRDQGISVRVAVIKFCEGQIGRNEEEEESTLENIVEFFQSKYFKKDSVITYHFPATSPTAEIVFTPEGKEDSKIKVENANVVYMIKKW